MSEEEKGTRTKECLHCKRFFDCDGKPTEKTLCIYFQKREEIKKNKK